jgi:hypothetical protein
MKTILQLLAALMFLGALLGGALGLLGGDLLTAATLVISSLAFGMVFYALNAIIEKLERMEALARRSAGLQEQPPRRRVQTQRQRRESEFPDF